MDWPLREIFLKYVERMKSSAREAHQHDVLVWAIVASAGGKMKYPDPPAVLRAPKIVIGG